MVVGREGLGDMEATKVPGVMGIRMTDSRDRLLELVIRMDLG